MYPRPFVHSLGLIAITVAVGLAIRFAPLGLPPFAVKYGGSMLWAMMVYWIASAFLPAWRLLGIVLLAGALATSVEFFKLYHCVPLDAFRHTLPGILLLGRFFSLWDIAAYWFAICIGALADSALRRLPGQTLRDARLVESSRTLKMKE
jgi:hypothetical protein